MHCTGLSLGKGEKPHEIGEVILTAPNKESVTTCIHNRGLRPLSTA